MARADRFGPEERRPDLYSGNALGRLGYEKPAVGLVLLREQILGPERFDAAFREYIRRWAFKHPRPWDFCRTMEDAAGADLTWFWRGWFYSNGRLDQAVTDVRLSGQQALITFRNLGELVMPLIYRVEYDDGSSETRRLPVEAWAIGEDEWTVGINAAGKRVLSVTVDPDQAFPDVNPDNNLWTAPTP
jgi:aminopeptidase N